MSRAGAQRYPVHDGGEDALYHPRRRRVRHQAHLALLAEPWIVVYPQVAVRRPAAGQQLAGVSAGADAAPGPLDGRLLTDDTSDAFLAVFTNGKVTADKVGPHADFLPDFPYLGSPHRA